MAKFQFKKKYPWKPLLLLVAGFVAAGFNIKNSLSISGKLDDIELLESRILESMWNKNNGTKNVDYFQMIKEGVQGDTSSNNNNNVKTTRIMDKILQYDTSKLPKWMNEYFEWHDQQIQLINESNWNDYRYMVLRCTRHDRQCGGTSDRLKPIPYLLRVAYETKRIFMIQWNRPCPLEEFLLPHKMNWSVPYWFEPFVEKDRLQYFRHINEATRWMQFAKDDGITILQGMMQSNTGGKTFLLDLVGPEEQDENQYVAFYHDMFRMMFRPSPPVARLVEQQMNHFGMVPGEYTVAQYRAFYRVKKENVGTKVLEAKSINAMNCASRLSPGSLIYFSSDSRFATDTAEHYANSRENSFARNLNLKDPLHLDFASRGNHTYPVADYYDSFVDLWIMGSGRCVTFGEGGFGLFASQLSYNATCWNEHFHWRTMNYCDWVDPATGLEEW